MWVICKNTIDYPGFYTARLQIVFEDKIIFPTGVTYVEKSMHSIRNKIPQNLTRIERSKEDDPVIVEIWL
jgi:hypothetical protein